MQVSEAQKTPTTHPLTATTQAARTGKADAAVATPSTPGNSASITSNDFLTLLVAEMKHQDPTANTDPNQYINQLVQVNSLQQLIQINSALGGTGATPAKGQSIAIANALGHIHAGLNQTDTLQAPTVTPAATAKSQF